MESDYYTDREKDEAIAHLRAQKAELLAALEYVAQCCERDGYTQSDAYLWLGDALFAARAAIAKAKVQP